MFFRLLGILVTLCVVGFLFIMMYRSGDSAVVNNPAVQEQKQTLQQATGVNVNDQKALQDYTLEQARQIQEYQNQQQAQPIPQE